MSGFIFQAITVDGKRKPYIIDGIPDHFEFDGETFVKKFERDKEQRVTASCKPVVMDDCKVFPSVSDAARYIAEERGILFKSARAHLSRAMQDHVRIYGHTWRFE